MSEVLKVSVILNNYNYEKYVGKAIQSVLDQTYSNFQLIIVDDFSEDSSREIINKYAERDKRIVTVFKENGGQASALNAGYAKACGDIIVFLDSDDYFRQDKLAKIVKYHAEGADYIHTDHQAVDSEENFRDDNIKRFKYSGRTVFPVYYLSKYPGNVTSTLSLSKTLADRIFPLENEGRWRIQADDPVVFHAGILSSSMHLSDKLTFYRIHGSNGYYGRENCDTYVYDLLIKRNKLKDEAIAKAGVSNTFLKNAFNLSAEFKTHNFVDIELLRLYLRVLWFEMDVPFLKKIQTSSDLWRTYMKSKKRKR